MIRRASGVVSWWQAEGNANDSISGNNGVITGGVTYAAGEVGQAFMFNTTNSYITVPASGSLNVGTNSGLTMEAWIAPADVVDSELLMGWVNGSSYGAMLKLSQPGQGSGCLFGNVIDTSGINHYFSTAAGLIQSNVFQHVALTYDKASGVATMYRNGVVVAQQNLGTFTPRTSYPFVMGFETALPVEPSYRGLMDEVSVYNRALASNEIAAIYNASVSGKCPPLPIITTQPTNQTVIAGGTATFNVAASGTPPLSYQWSFKGTNIAGATNTILTLTNVQLNQAGNYTVQVANTGGSVLSSNAVLTVNLPVPPTITTQPTNQTVFAGNTASFNVAATSTSPLFYQWNLNGTNISGATNTTLILANVQFSQAGAYSVMVSNALGSILSSNALLTVFGSSLMQNGGFELGTFQYWTTSGNFDWCSVNSDYVHSGVYGAELGTWPALPCYISQTLSTTIGQSYLISCWLYCDGQTPNEFSVLWNGTTLFDQQNMGVTTWTNLQFYATATSTSTVLTFNFSDEPSYLGLDDIVVIPMNGMPLQFQTAKVNNGKINVGWGAQAGRLYQVQYTTNLDQIQWINWGGVLSTAGSAITVNDDTTGSPTRFYRIVLLPATLPPNGN